MINRKVFLGKINIALAQKNLLWLSGVRRVGKTTLVRMIKNINYYDCELPSHRRQLEDPEYFWKSQNSGNIIVLDEVHRLTDPSNVLKIATDHFPELKIIATGSSTLAAKRKFKDTLTDRKRDLWLLPLLLSELKHNNMLDLDKRYLRGGLPPAYISDELQNDFYTEWLDSFWAKDVQELFAVEKKTSFLKLAELILRHSGEIFEASSYSSPCEISRQTVSNYLDILTTTLFTLPLRPFSQGRSQDIVSAPKVYAFDTGFVCFARGWDHLRPDDKGSLLEHLVLNELHTIFGRNNIFYWRDKQKHEVDFIIKPSRGKQVHAVECKLNYNNFEGNNLNIFRKHYPHGKNFIIAENANDCLKLKIKGNEIIVLSPFDIPKIRNYS